MRVLVTGAFGFVGTAVTRRLAMAGHEVVAATRREAGVPLPGVAEGVSVVRGDVRDVAAMRRAVAGVDAVVHLAALTRVRESFERADEYQAVNAGGTRSLLKVLQDEAMRTGGVARFVLASTAAVYGVAERQPIDETAICAPTSPYAESKVQAETAVRRAADEGVGAVVLRVFNVGGSVGGRVDDDPSRVIPRTLAVAAGTAEVLEVNGDGGAVRDYVHVDDVARAYVLAVEACAPGRAEVLNVGGVGASVAEIVAAAERVTGRPIAVRHLPPRPEPAVLRADISRIAMLLGWKPERSSLDWMVGDAWRALTGRPPAPD